MIKVIKEGKKSFVATCPTCGCEFSYELEDITMSGYVYCPCCNESVTHKSQAGDERRGGAKYNDYPINMTFYCPSSKTRYATNTSDE